MKKPTPMFDGDGDATLDPQIHTLEQLYSRAELPASLSWEAFQARVAQARTDLPLASLPQEEEGPHTQSDGPSMPPMNNWSYPVPTEHGSRVIARLPRFLSGLPSLAAVLLIMVLTVALFASHARLVGPGASGPGSSSWSSWSSLLDIAMVSPTDGWAVGETSLCTGTASNNQCSSGYPLMLHYQQGRWVNVALPFTKTGPHSAMLNSIQMLSATDGWASGPGHLLHYDGHSWKLVASPAQIGLEFLQMFSDTDGWAIGSTDIAGEKADIMHFDGKTWTAQPLPAGLGIGPSTTAVNANLAMTSPTQGWAVYTVSQAPPSSDNPYEPSKTFILHYTGGVWTVQKSIQGDATLESISMSSATDGWAVGQITDPSLPNTQHALLMHYTRGDWVQIDNTIPENAYWVSMVSATDGWMIGGQGSLTLLHYTGTQWVPVAFSPEVQQALGQTFSLSRLHMTSATEGWAVGAVDHHPANEPTPSDGITFFDENTHPLILHYQAGIWSIASS
jgi:hypothetical protein